MQSSARPFAPGPSLARSRPRQVSRFSRLITARSAGDRTSALRQLLNRPGILLGPAVFDGISARLTEQAGFDFAFLSGFSVAGARLGAPDTGLLSYAEMLDQGRNMHEATSSIPIIGDADTGYGNAMNVKRTVRGYAAAGFAGILIEDQEWPKSCGHVRGKRVVGREEAIARVRAACDARDEGSDIVVVARTDARQAESFQEAMERAAAFAAVGADVVFVDALESAAEMRTLCVQVQGAHKMANMLEGGGKTPILTPAELEAMGFKVCAYPLSLLGVSVAAMRKALAGLQQGLVPLPPEMPTFQELQAALGFPEYFEEEARYAVPAANRSGSGSSKPEPGAPAYVAPLPSALEAAAAAASPVSTAVEPDAVMEPGAATSSSGSDPGGGGARESPPPPASSPSGTIDLYSGSRDEDGGGYRQRDASDRRSQWLRIRVSEARSGTTKLDTRFPAGFLDGVASFIPQVAGVDLSELIRRSKGGEWEPGQALLDFTADDDRVEIFLEFI